MAKILPVEIDEILIQLFLVLFLAINYNQPLASVYWSMTVLVILSYWIPYTGQLLSPKFRKVLDNMIPIRKRNTPRPFGVGIGVVIGMAFILLYGFIVSSDTLGKVFATTFIEQSLIITNLVYVILIPVIESTLFFRNIFAWITGLTNSTVRVSPFSGLGAIWMLVAGVIFAWFHVSVKGLDDMQMLATFLFGAISMGTVLYFQELIQAIFAHITVNAKAMGLFALGVGGAILSVPLILIGGGVLLYTFSDIIIDMI